MTIPASTSNSEAGKPGEAPKLAQTLGLFSATAIVIGSMIGFLREITLSLEAVRLETKT